jgi:hypothetical protein
MSFVLICAGNSPVGSRICLANRPLESQSLLPILIKLLLVIPVHAKTLGWSCGKQATAGRGGR